MRDAHKINGQVNKIPSLESISPYGTEYQLWDKTTEALVREIFGDEAAKLFRQQESVIIPNDDNEWREQYIRDLGKKKRLLEGLLVEKAAFKRMKKAGRNGTAPPGAWVEGFVGKFVWLVIVALAVAVGAGLILHYVFGIG